MKKIIYLLSLLLILTGVSCTKKFNEINQSARGLPSIDFPSQTYLPSMMRWIYPDNGDGYGDFRAQTAYNLTSDVFSGYFGSNWSSDNPSTYLLNLGWNGSLFDSWSRAMGLFSVIQTNSNTIPKSLDSTILGMGFVVKVLFSQTVADYYGTLPYTSFGALQATYDPLDKIYQTFFNELDSALIYLDTAKATTAGIDNSVDLFYGGNQKQWVKLVNSLRMRLAMRIVKVNPTLAKLECEKAMANEGGLLVDNKDNATFHASTFNNPIYVYMYNYNGCRSSAEVICFLKGRVDGVSDPRLSIYVKKGADSAAKVPNAGDYVGIRLGVLLQGGTTGNSRYYSEMGSYCPKVPSSPSWALSNLPLFVAAETNFLLAEADLRRWNMGTNTKGAQFYYEAGVDASMQQWNVTRPSDYYTNVNYLKADFVDAVLDTRNINADNVITSYAYDNGNRDIALEQIITQKWIAMWPGGGVNAWSEYRRTGYPRLFPPFAIAPTLSPTITKTILQNGTQQVNNTRKLGLPQNEYTNNPTNVRKAVVEYLGGNDDINSLVWWDKPGTANF